ncbi:MAG: hypothetical protein H7338_11110 [Candidatus Sericytochromatia bacterium]|nr:hypothetical protein [Candidatus Sericytochromatia bacterium]
MARLGYLVVNGVIRQFVVDDSRTAPVSIVNNMRSNHLSRLHELDEVAKLDGF